LRARPDPIDAALGLDARDAGCGETCALLERYVEAERRGLNARARFPGAAVHLDFCPACGADHDGLLALTTTRGTRWQLH
jgi:hypothetical protein